MSEWKKFINALGKKEASSEFSDLEFSIGETAQKSEDSIDDNDAIGHTKYYKFFQSGLEIGFRENILNHIHFYFDNNDGYDVFTGELLCGIGSGYSEIAVRKALGEPDKNGGGKSDILLGYINRWVKYESEGYALHLQFNQEDQLCMASIIFLDAD
ncbi:DUF5680 domain-containing protein [Erwinia rhapontici]|uniref:hypothetical protein n=1 Tax=Erwinia rhapontici TaxID=55212 RepID=UPI003D35AC07